MQHMTSSGLYLRLLKYVAPYWRIFALSLLGMVIVGLTEVVPEAPPRATNTVSSLADRRPIATSSVPSALKSPDTIDPISLPTATVG